MNSAYQGSKAAHRSKGATEAPQHDTGGSSRYRSSSCGCTLPQPSYCLVASRARGCTRLHVPL